MAVSDEAQPRAAIRRARPNLVAEVARDSRGGKKEAYAHDHVRGMLSVSELDSPRLRDPTGSIVPRCQPFLSRIPASRSASTGDRVFFLRNRPPV